MESIESSRKRSIARAARWTAEAETLAEARDWKREQNLLLRAAGSAPVGQLTKVGKVDAFLAQLAKQAG